jgi:hypothetical protein
VDVFLEPWNREDVISPAVSDVEIVEDYAGEPWSFNETTGRWESGDIGAGESSSLRLRMLRPYGTYYLLLGTSSVAGDGVLELDPYFSWQTSTYLSGDTPTQSEEIWMSHSDPVSQAAGGWTYITLIFSRATSDSNGQDIGWMALYSSRQGMVKISKYAPAFVGAGPKIQTASVYLHAGSSPRTGLAAYPGRTTTPPSLYEYTPSGFGPWGVDADVYATATPSITPTDPTAESAIGWSGRMTGGLLTMRVKIQ